MTKRIIAQCSEEKNPRGSCKWTRIHPIYPSKIATTILMTSFHFVAWTPCNQRRKTCHWIDTHSCQRHIWTAKHQRFRKNLLSDTNEKMRHVSCFPPDYLSPFSIFRFNRPRCTFDNGNATLETQMFQALWIEIFGEHVNWERYLCAREADGSCLHRTSWRTSCQTFTLSYSLHIYPCSAHMFFQQFHPHL